MANNINKSLSKKNKKNKKEPQKVKNKNWNNPAAAPANKNLDSLSYKGSHHLGWDNCPCTQIGLFMAQKPIAHQRLLFGRMSAGLIYAGGQNTYDTPLLRKYFCSFILCLF